MAKARTTLADQLRQAIDESQLTNYALAGMAGVPEPSIWRFRRGEQDLRLETAWRIVEALGLEVALRRRARVAKPARKAPQRAELPDAAGDDLADAGA